MLNILAGWLWGAIVITLFVVLPLLVIAAPVALLVFAVFRERCRSLLVLFALLAAFYMVVIGAWMHYDITHPQISEFGLSHLFPFEHDVLNVILGLYAFSMVAFVGHILFASRRNKSQIFQSSLGAAESGIAGNREATNGIHESNQEVL